MRHTLTILFILLITSCSKQRAALYHYNQVNHLVEKAERFLNSYLQKIDETMINDQLPDRFNEAEMLRQRSVKKIEAFIRKAKNIHFLKEDNSYHEGAVAYFEGFRDILTNELHQLIAINKQIAASEQLSDSASTILVIFQNKKTNYIGEFKKVRDAFAKNHEMILLTNEKKDGE